MNRIKQQHTSKAALAPCPFCNSTSLEVDQCSCEHCSNYFVACNQCGAQGPSRSEFETVARASWNNRGSQ